MHVLCYYELVLYDFSLTFCPFILFLHFVIFSFIFFSNILLIFIFPKPVTFLWIFLLCTFLFLYYWCSIPLKCFLLNGLCSLNYCFLGGSHFVFFFFSLFIWVLLFLLMGLFKYMMSMACSFMFRKDDLRKLIKSLSHGNGLFNWKSSFALSVKKQKISSSEVECLNTRVFVLEH